MPSAAPPSPWEVIPLGSCARDNGEVGAGGSRRCRIFVVLGRIGKAAGQPQNLQNLRTDLRQLPVCSSPSFFLKPCVITHRARHVGELGPADAWSWKSDSNAEPQKSNLPWGRSGRYVKIRGNKRKGVIGGAETKSPVLSSVDAMPSSAESSQLGIWQRGAPCTR